MLDAYIYARFSSAGQRDGHSIERQLQDCKHYIERNGWNYSPDREIKDEGRSAFSGENRQIGSQFYEFEQQVMSGQFSDGVVLVVENIDRLTRQGYEAAFDLLRLLTQNGVTVAITHDNAIYEAGERIDMASVMMMIIKSELAYNESKKKSVRIQSVWQSKVEKAISGEKQLITPTVPAWLLINPDTREIEENTRRVAVLKEIYQWYIDGNGLMWIVKNLNERKEPNWTPVRKSKTSGWNTTYIHRILTNRSVLGEFQPFKHSRTILKDSVSGSIIPDYFPAVISNEQFNRVQSLLKQRTRTGGQARHTQRNLFSSIAHCGECGSVMYYQNGQKVGTPVIRSSGKTYIHKTERSYLKCDNSRRNHGCSNKTAIRYETLVQSVIARLLVLVVDDSFIKPKDSIVRLKEQIAELQRLHGLKSNQLNNVMDNLLESHSRILAKKASELEQEVDALAGQIASLESELAVETHTAAPDENVKAVIAVKDALDSDDGDIARAARIKVHQAFQGLFHQMKCFPSGMVAIWIEGIAIWMFDKDGDLVQFHPILERA